MSGSFLPEFDFEDFDAEPLSVTLVPAREALGEPALVVHVRRIKEEAYNDLQRPLIAAIAKAAASKRPEDEAAVETERAKFRRAYVEKVYADITGATVRNLDYLLRRNNAKVGPKMRAAIEAREDRQAPFSVELAAAMIEQCRTADWDQPVAKVATFGIVQAEEKREGN